MNVVAHGNVDEFCEKHGMRIVARHEGKLADYAGKGVVLVTDNCADKYDYFYMKFLFSQRRIELVSTHWESVEISEFVEYLSRRVVEDRRNKHKGRRRFGTIESEKIVLDRICELRQAGYTLKRISEEVRYPDGREMSLSSIQKFLRDRGIE